MLPLDLFKDRKKRKKKEKKNPWIEPTENFSTCEYFFKNIKIKIKVRHNATRNF